MSAPSDDDGAAHRARFVAMAEETGIPLTELVELWMTDTSSHLDAASAALAAGDMATAGREAHTAAGAGSLSGAAPLAEGLQAVEALALTGRAKDAARALSDVRSDFDRICQALRALVP